MEYSVSFNRIQYLKTSSLAIVSQSFHRYQAAVIAPLFHNNTFPKLPVLSTPRFSSKSLLIAKAMNNDVVTDDNVPEGHKGLHSYLYGDSGMDDDGHREPTSLPFTFHEGEDDGTAIVPIDTYLESRNSERPVGVFALYDVNRHLQYVGYSRNTVLSIRTLRSRVGEDRCAFVRVMVFANKAMQTRSALQREADNWITEAGVVPPGNGIESDLWQMSPQDMTNDDFVEYEDKKDKLQRAMGVKKESVDISDDNSNRSGNLKSAMKNGDWSEVIDAQTSETTTTITTPFARANVHRAVGSNESLHSQLKSQHSMMTVDAVDKALDDIRPYLIADGGNVDVVSVSEDGVIELELQGACGTCPSSSSTMKMGIERALRAAFGDQVKDVVAVGGGNQDVIATVEAIDMHLNMLRGAIAAYGGSVEVLEVDGGVARLRYSGPKPIGYGMVAAVKDKFKDLNDVQLFDKDTGDLITF